MRAPGLQASLIALLLAILPLAGGQAQKPPAPDAAPDRLKRAEAAFRAGLAAQKSGNAEAARVKFAEAARLAPAIPEAHQALGAVLLELEKPAEAIPELETALKLKPGEPGIESDLAMAY